MSVLNNELISQFVKSVTGDQKSSRGKKAKKETFSYGTVVKENGYTYVRLDGSELLTRVAATADTIDGERVVVMIKNHQATITGNISSPAARVGDFDTVKEIANTANQAANEAKKTMALLFDLVYPIGSLYLSINSTHPADLFGGEWEQIQDRFLLGASDTYSGGTTGGEATHTLTVDEIPSHSHVQQWYVEGGTNAIRPMGEPSGGTGSGSPKYWGPSSTTSTTNSIKTYVTGGSKPHNNMPPYLAVFIWKRIK